MKPLTVTGRYDSLGSQDDAVLFLISERIKYILQCILCKCMRSLDTPTGKHFIRIMIMIVIVVMMTAAADSVLIIMMFMIVMMMLMVVVMIVMVFMLLVVMTAPDRSVGGAHRYSS